jgi:hypothetical protein
MNSQQIVDIFVSAIAQHYEIVLVSFSVAQAIFRFLVRPWDLPISATVDCYVMIKDWCE